MSKSYLVKCDPLDGGCGTVYPGDLSTCPECGGATSLMAVDEPIDPLIYAYDIETYPNIFTCAILHPSSGIKFMFEISIRINMCEQFVAFIRALQRINAVMVGYNNLHFDYPVIHHIVVSREIVSVEEIYTVAMNIIKGHGQTIWENQHIVRQVDLFKLNHYDNTAKSTSLKALEFSMRMDSIQDLPVELGKWLTSEEMNELISYNWHDIEATVFFYVRCLEQINFRKELSEKYDKDFTNMSDSKIGSEIFIMKLNQVGINTHCRLNGKREVINTKRETVQLKDCIPDYIKFETPEFQNILQQFKATTLHGDNVKALFKNFSTKIDGIEHVFGAGGQHACRPGYFASDDDYCILDLDVEAYYPSLIIAGDLTTGYYPEHLSEKFSPMFKELIAERIAVGKKTAIGTAIKLQLNSTFGNMGNKYSPIFDLKCLLSVTLTGQLALTILIEQLLKVSKLKVIQVNTDGFTVKMLRKDLIHVTVVVTWWEKLTHLKMEYAYYSRLWMADVNNYISEYED